MVRMRMLVGPLATLILSSESARHLCIALTRITASSRLTFDRSLLPFMWGAAVCSDSYLFDLSAGSLSAQSFARAESRLSCLSISSNVPQHE